MQQNKEYYSMDSQQRERLQVASDNNWELRKLLIKKQEIESRLQRLGSMSFHTADEQVEEKHLKWIRLATKERMQTILTKLGM
jgi:hypothetical protein